MNLRKSVLKIYNMNNSIILMKYFLIDSLNLHYYNIFSYI